MNIDSKSIKPRYRRVAQISLAILLLYILVSSSIRLLWLLPSSGYGWLSIGLHIAFLLTFVALVCLLFSSKRFGALSVPLALLVIFAGSALLLVHDVTGAMVSTLSKSRIGLAWFTGLYCNGSLAGCLSLPSAPVVYVLAVASALTILAAFARPAIVHLSTQWWNGAGQKTLLRTMRLGLIVAALAYPLAAMLYPRNVVAMDPVASFIVREPIDAPPELLLAKPGRVILPSAEPATPRPLVLIIVDALRADHVETRPGLPTLTPFLQQQRMLGTLHDYRDGITMCSASYCGITAILGSRSWTGQEQGRPVNLMDALARYGYESHLVLSAPFRPAFNYSVLFGPNIASFSEQARAGEQADDRAVPRALQSVKIGDGKRTAIIIQLMSAHPGGLRFTENKSGPQLLMDVVFSKDGEREYRHYYNEGVRQADSVIGDIFKILQQKGLGDALIIVTADHGEGLGGPGGFFHGSGVNVEVAKVPFLVIDPRKQKWPEQRLVSTLDVAPTLLRAIGGEPVPEWEGTALQDGRQREVAPIDDVKSTGVVTLDSERLVLVKCDLASGRKESFDLHNYRPVPLSAAAKSFAKLPQRRDAGRCR